MDSRQTTENDDPGSENRRRAEVDWVDLSRKMRAVMKLVAELAASGGGLDGRNSYGDELYAFVEEGDRDSPEKIIRLLWVSPGLDPYDKKMFLPSECRRDERDHETLLRKHFEDFFIIIRKGPRLWTCIVQSPQPPLLDGSRRRAVVVPYGRGSLGSLPSVFKTERTAAKTEPEASVAAAQPVDDPVTSLSPRQKRQMQKSLGLAYVAVAVFFVNLVLAILVLVVIFWVV